MEVYEIKIHPLPTPRPRVRTIVKNGKRINATYYPSHYQAYKDELTIRLRLLGIPQKNYGILRVVFGIPYPQTVKGGKKERIEGKPHQQKPDLDNFLKGKKDGLTQSGILIDDSSIYYIEASKVWTNTSGYIKFFLKI